MISMPPLERYISNYDSMITFNLTQGHDNTARQGKNVVNHDQE